MSIREQERLEEIYRDQAGRNLVAEFALAIRDIQKAATVRAQEMESYEKRATLAFAGIEIGQLKIDIASLQCDIDTQERETNRIARMQYAGLLLTKDVSAVGFKGFECKQVQVNDDDGSLEAYGSVFGVVDRQNDRVMRGAFSQSIKELGGAGVPLLWQHDTTEPLGRALELKEDSRGLWFKGVIRKSARRGSEALDLLKHKVVDSFSIGYMVRNGGSRMVGGVRELTNIELLELSIATIPANPRAQLI